MNRSADDSSDSRFFDGGAEELQEIRSKESLQRFFRRKKSRRSFLRLFYLVVFIGLSVIFVLMCLSLFFKVAAVEIVGTTRYTSEQIMEYLNIQKGQNLYGIDRKEVSSLVGRLAYVREATLTRELPHTLVITLQEEEPVYYCCLYGEYFSLSDNLQVVEKLPDAEGAGESLIYLELPPVDTAIIGRTVKFFTESDMKYVAAYLDILQSSVIAERTTAFDLRDRFSLYLICDGKYLVELADGSDLATKFKTLSQILKTDAFKDIRPAKIDMSNPSESSAIYVTADKIVFVSPSG